MWKQLLCNTWLCKMYVTSMAHNCLICVQGQLCSNWLKHWFENIICLIHNWFENIICLIHNCLQQQLWNNRLEFVYGHFSSTYLFELCMRRSVYFLSVWNVVQYSNSCVIHNCVKCTLQQVCNDCLTCVW
jgi:hypothetical protein